MKFLCQNCSSNNVLNYTVVSDWTRSKTEFLFLSPEQVGKSACDPRATYYVRVQTFHSVLFK